MYQVLDQSTADHYLQIASIYSPITEHQNSSPKEYSSFLKGWKPQCDLLSVLALLHHFSGVVCFDCTHHENWYFPFSVEAETDMFWQSDFLALKITPPCLLLFTASKSISCSTFSVSLFHGSCEWARLPRIPVPIYSQNWHHQTGPTGIWDFHSKHCRDPHLCARIFDHT